MKPIRSMTQIELAAFVQNHLAKRDIRVLLSGGAAVSFYAGGLYVSKDIDLVAEWGLKKAALNRAMEEIGFIETGKYFVHPEATDLVEILPGPPAVGESPVGAPVEIELSTGTLRLLNPTDCVKDRLAGYFYWNDTESLRQAILVARRRTIDLEEIRKWSEAEGQPEKFESFLAMLAQD